MPNDATLRLFLPCAAGVEALLRDEVAGLLPGVPVQRAARRRRRWTPTPQA